MHIGVCASKNSFSLKMFYHIYCGQIVFRGAVRFMVENSEEQQGIVILRRPQVERRTGLTKSGIYFLIREGGFPRPVRLGVRAVGWVEGEVSAWLAQKAGLRSLSIRP